MTGNFCRGVHIGLLFVTPFWILLCILLWWWLT